MSLMNYKSHRMKNGQILLTAICSRPYLLMILVFSLPSSPVMSAQSLNRTLDIPEMALETKWETDTYGNREFNFYVNDFCDYYLFIEHDRSYNLRPGKNTVFEEVRGSQSGYNPFSGGGRYRCYRGRFPKRFDPSLPYALPVRPGIAVEWMTDRRERHKTMNFKMSPGDTVYAVRSGSVCMTIDGRLLLVYHSDNTFAAYMTLSGSMLSPGDEVTVGQPVGIAGLSGVSVSFFFLDGNKFEAYEASGYPYTHFVPVFRTSEGDLYLEEDVAYTAVADEGLIMQDMTPAAKKRHIKKMKKK